jgi:hypothetical protein
MTAPERPQLPPEPARTAQRQLERGCRRLLALYPARHRRVHEEEMVGVLLASAHDGQRRLAPRDAADLIVGAARIWLRRAGRLRHPDGAAALALLSVLAPVLLCAEAVANSGLLGIVWVGCGGFVPPWIRLPNLVAISLLHGPGFWLLTAAGPVTLGLALCGLRRTAAFAALLLAGAGAATASPVPTGVQYASDPLVAITLCTSVVAAAALLLSDGPARGLRMFRRPAITLAGAAALTLAVLGLGACFEIQIGGHLYSALYLIGDTGVIHRSGLDAAELSAVAGIAILVVAAARSLRSAVGRRVLLLLALPALPYLLPELWRLALADPSLPQWLSPFLPLVNLISLVLFLAAALLAALVPLPPAWRLRRPRWHEEGNR